VAHFTLSHARIYIHTAFYLPLETSPPWVPPHNKNSFPGFLKLSGLGQPGGSLFTFLDRPILDVRSLFPLWFRCLRFPPSFE